MVITWWKIWSSGHFRTYGEKFRLMNLSLVFKKVIVSDEFQNKRKGSRIRQIKYHCVTINKFWLVGIVANGSHKRFH